MSGSVFEGSIYIRSADISCVYIIAVPTYVHVVYIYFMEYITAYGLTYELENAEFYSNLHYCIVVMSMHVYSLVYIDDPSSSSSWVGWVSYTAD